MSSLRSNTNSTYTAPNAQLLSTPFNSILTNGDADLGAEEDPKLSVFKELYLRSESRLERLFASQNAEHTGASSKNLENSTQEQNRGTIAVEGPKPAAYPRKAARAIDEDDYEESDGEAGDSPASLSPSKPKTSAPLAVPAFTSTPMLRGTSSSSVQTTPKAAALGKSSEDVRKRLEEDKKAVEDAAKRSFHTLFYTLENDRDAMLDQRKLEESERQVDVEMSGTAGPGVNSNNAIFGNVQQGTLSQTNLGASSLTLKHLIARIDTKRDQVRASDADLRSLMSEVRKNRSKWASEERVGQEELYEAAEKVLTELKAMTEHSTAFLQRVNKREAPDYYNVIKQPMDLGTMTKKLKAVQYKSKQEFVHDLNLIWSNCLRYNATPDHFLRRHAKFMQKETEKLVPLIPAITIRDRAEVEAEERRLHQAEAEMDGGEESDDEPIITQRGRKAPGKKAKKGSTAPRKAPAGTAGSTSVVETQSLASHSLGPNLKHELPQADSEAGTEKSQTDTLTPPPATLTPTGINGTTAHNVSAGEPEGMDIDGVEHATNGIGTSFGDIQEQVEHDDPEYKIWKQVTKKDRAIVTAERHRLFKNDRLNVEEPALLRKRSGMRRWLQKQKQATLDGAIGSNIAEIENTEGNETGQSGETLAEGMEGEEERVLPDYYDSLSALPELESRLRWVEKVPGQLDEPSEFLRVLPKGLFTSPESPLTKKLDENMRQLQATRKICSKIGMIKQMQMQSQMYHGQFQKADPAPLIEQDIEPHVMNDDGPVMNSETCRSTFQRSIGKLFFHAGFEEFQPSALEAVTDLARDFFTKITKTLVDYLQRPKIGISKPIPGSFGESEIAWEQCFSMEEMILHTLQENGSDLEALDSYVKDEIDRSGTKLTVMQDRMRTHLAELLRPALTDAGPDGSNAFNDGSDQFVSGDFAEDFGEDFFGFRELGLDKELGLSSLGVPLHLLQNRMHSVNQAQNPSNLTSSLPSALESPPPLSPLTVENVADQIGLVQDFFSEKLRANDNKPLIEDEDLPQKQRFPKPRLPPSGKISSPRKRPIREPGPGKGHPRKKMKLTNEPDNNSNKTAAEKVKLNPPSESQATAGTGPSPAAVAVKPKDKEKGGNGEKAKENGNAVVNDVAMGGMLSPESLEAT
ncbi:MAG: hypothetical protein LQ342_001325 [Letrouitia transgressa]|nr:MAG: hypothetical protein LQ342_001325 [Letrouitia transgressa]